MAEPDGIVEELCLLLSEWGVYQLDDTERANRAMDRCNDIARRLNQLGQLVPTCRVLMNHETPAVAEYAASFMLAHDPVSAEAVLTRIARMPGNIGLNATMTLWVWRRGTLKLPPGLE